MRKLTALILTGVLITFSLVGCGQNTRLNPSSPTTLSIWHVYGNQSESPFNDAIDEFNSTVGKEKGVFVSVTSMVDSDSIDQHLFDAAKGTPGSGDFPDLFTAYPRVAEGIGEELLTDWNEIYSEEELSVFVDDFLAEGNISGRQLTLPIAKSTELLFVNKTLFDRFANESGFSVKDFETFDGLFEMASAYYEWSDGKDLFQYDDFYNYFLINVAAKGDELIKNGKVNCDTNEFKDVFYAIAEPGIEGGISLYDNFGSDLWKTGDIISYIGSSAGILYTRDDVTYPDNSVEKIELSVLAYPVFEGAAPTVMQRGVTLFAHKTDDAKKNQAMEIFVDFLAEKDNNIEFASASGYIPGTDEAFEGLFTNLEGVENPKYRMLYEAVSDMYGKYTFKPLPVFENSSVVQKEFDGNVTNILSKARTEYQARVSAGEDKNTVLPELCEKALNELKSKY